MEKKEKLQENNSVTDPEFDNDLPEFTVKEKRLRSEGVYQSRRRRISPAVVFFVLGMLVLLSVWFIRNGVLSLGFSSLIVLIVWAVELALGILTEDVPFWITLSIMGFQLVLGYFFASLLWMLLGVFVMIFAMACFSVIKGYL